MTPYYSDALVTLWLGDCRELLPTVAADVVVTDPPYGTGGWRRPAAGAGSNPKAALTREAWDDGDTDWLLRLPTFVPVLTFWPAARTLALLIEADRVGRTKHRTLYYRKPDPKPQVGGRTRWSVEPIWSLSEDGFLLTGGDDVYTATAPRAGRDAESVGHPYQKPVALMRWLIGKTTGAVLDPFAGSGSTLVAAKSLGRRSVGIELDERWLRAGGDPAFAGSSRAGRMTTYTSPARNTAANVPAMLGARHASGRRPCRSAPRASTDPDDDWHRGFHEAARRVREMLAVAAPTSCPDCGRRLEWTADGDRRCKFAPEGTRAAWEAGKRRYGSRPWLEHVASFVDGLLSETRP